MTHLTGNPGQLPELARYEVRPEALDEVLRAIHPYRQIDANAHFRRV